MKKIDNERRRLLKGGFLLGSGLLLGFPSLSECGSEPNTVRGAGSSGENAIDLIRNEHTQLAGEEIREWLVGNTVYGLVHKSTRKAALCKCYFDPNGSCILLMDDGRMETGTWEIDGDVIRAQWPTIADNDLLEGHHYLHSNGCMHVFVCKDHPEKHRWAWFHVEEGKDKEFES